MQVLHPKCKLSGSRGHTGAPRSEGPWLVRCGSSVPLRALLSAKSLSASGLCLVQYIKVWAGFTPHSAHRLERLLLALFLLLATRGETCLGAKALGHGPKWGHPGIAVCWWEHRCCGIGALVYSSVHYSPLAECPP